KYMDFIFKYLQDCYFLNTDFRDFFRKCYYKDNIERCFCYCDPPYLGMTNNYSNSFTEKDSRDLFDILQAAGVKFALSEFDHPFILEQAKERKLNLIYVGERTNLKNRR